MGRSRIPPTGHAYADGGASLRATPEDVAKAGGRRPHPGRLGRASMKATPEDVAKPVQSAPPHRGEHASMKATPEDVAKKHQLNAADVDHAPASMKATPEDVAKPDTAALLVVSDGLPQ